MTPSPSPPSALPLLSTCFSLLLDRSFRRRCLLCVCVCAPVFFLFPALWRAWHFATTTTRRDGERRLNRFAIRADSSPNCALNVGVDLAAPQRLRHRLPEGVTRSSSSSHSPPSFSSPTSAKPPPPSVQRKREKNGKKVAVGARRRNKSVRIIFLKD